MKHYLIWSQVILLAIALFSCGKVKHEPIELIQVKNNTVNLIHIDPMSYSLAISGGDGTYSATCSDDKVLQVSVVEGHLMLQPKGVGQAEVVISDGAGNSYKLSIGIRYDEESFTVVSCQANVVGSMLTTEQVKEVEQKALATIPVKVNGGYKFVYNDNKANKGKLTIYPQKLNEDGIEVEFEKVTSDGQAEVFVFELNGQKRRLVRMVYNGKESPAVQIALAEDVSDRFKTEYSDLERVSTQQVILYMSGQ